MTRLAEAGSGRLHEQTAAGGRRQVTIIQAGWGSSGYYSREVLARDGPRIFPTGTHMFLDHPTRSEEVDRPERSVRDLAARIATSPRMEGDRLVAEAEVFPVWQPVVDSLAESIGLSIRAIGEVEEGEAEGRRGPIVTTLTEGISVDFVTEAGAGGEVGQLIESARAVRTPPAIEEARNAGHWLEARVHREFTFFADELFGEGHLTREERIALSQAIGDGLTAFNVSLVEQAPGLYRRDPFDDPDDPITVTEHHRQEATMADNQQTQQQITQLQEQISQHEQRIGQVESERDQHKDRADRAEDALLQRDAERVVREATHTPEGADKPVSIYQGLPERAVERVVRAALTEKPPMGEDGKLDQEKLADRARRAAKEERDYLAEAGASPNGGGPRVTGMGSRPSDGAAQTNGAGGSGSSDPEAGLVESFKRLGMSETAAKVAAEGR